jgi:hypothetical protein
MWMDTVFERFVTQSPFSVMTRATLENLFADSFLDQLFHEHAQLQYHRELAFSTVTTLLTQVVLRYRPSVRSAYTRTQGIPATLKAVYEKLQHVETVVAQELVRQTADRADRVLQCWPQALRPDPIDGLRLRILDGNYLAGTQHRLAPLRCDGAAALPGMSVVLREDRTGLLRRLVCREDAYTNERALLDDLLAWVEKDDLLVVDRNFCWFDFLLGLIDRGAFFVCRHHEQVGLTEITPLRRVGRTQTGEVYEQEVEIGPPRRRVRLRCLVIKLYEPTREGDTEIRLLSNVPLAKAAAPLLADLYLRRWTIEHSFQELTEYLRCEVNTLGYPKAALFGFCLAVCAYNVLAVLKGALAAVYGQAKVEAELSSGTMAQEISQDTSGLLIALPTTFWKRFARMSSVELAAWLKQTAARVSWQSHQKSKRSPRKKNQPPPPKRKGGRRRSHVSTARMLDNRAQL